MIEILLFILSAVIVPVILTDLADWSPRIATRIINWAARRLDSPSATARYSEEWAAELAEVPGKFSKLGLALQKVLYLPRIVRAAQGVDEKVDQESRAEKELVRSQIIASAWMFSDIFYRHLNEYDRKELGNIASHDHIDAREVIFDLVEPRMAERYWNLRKTNPDFALPKPESKKWVSDWISQLADVNDLEKILNLPVFRQRT